MNGLHHSYLCTAKRIICIFTDDNKTIEKTGTCFFVKNKDDKMCLVTNRHVVDIDYQQKTSKYKDFKLLKILVQCKSTDTATNLPTIDTELVILNKTEFKFSSNKENDIACLIEPKVFNSTSPGSLTAVIDFWVPYNLIATEEKLNNDLTICDFVAFPGFPEWYDVKNRLPIIRTGTIASDPRLDYSEKEEDQGNRIAYEAFSYGGSSGSPVFAISKGILVSEGLSGGGYRAEMLIGINAGHYNVTGSSTKEHSGLSYLYKSSSIIDIIDN